MLCRIRNGLVRAPQSYKASSELERKKGPPPYLKKIKNKGGKECGVRAIHGIAPILDNNSISLNYCYYSNNDLIGILSKQQKQHVIWSLLLCL